MMSTRDGQAKAQLQVFLIDEHPVVRAGLRSLLEAEPDLSVVGEAGDGHKAIEAIALLRPDVVVTELLLSPMSGAEATEQIKLLAPEAKVLALTAQEGRGYVQLMIEAGASGYLLKRAAVSEIVRAVRAVAGGGLYLDPDVAAQVVSGPSSGPPRSGVRLSEREVEVLRLIAEGHAMKEIAASLVVSTRTLETYRARAMDKLGFRTRAEIVQYALSRGWLKSG
ncbi:MAG: hypothetical protein JWP97_1581 [Labilithrix sp.]|nr:hypothetical protein [Labilithrix sp.]